MTYTLLCSRIAAEILKSYFTRVKKEMLASIDKSEYY